MGESRPFCQENFLFPKKRPKTAFFGGNESGVSWLWEELYAKLLGLGQLLGYPWKVWGITVQTSYWEGRWDQNWVRSRPAKKVACGNANLWKTGFFYSSASSSRTKRDIKIGPTGEMIVTYWATNALLTKSDCGEFGPCFACPKLGDAGRTWVASKNREVLEKISRPQFWS